MATKTTIEEHKFLVLAENDIVQYGKTSKKCPRCGNEIILEEKKNSYTIRCKTDNCISASFRGL